MRCPRTLLVLVARVTARAAGDERTNGQVPEARVTTSRRGLLRRPGLVLPQYGGALVDAGAAVAVPR